MKRSGGPTSPPGTRTPNALAQFATWGILLVIVGGSIMGFAWPSSSYDVLTDDVSRSGSAVGFLTGALIAWLGNSLLMVGLIGWGVKYGRDAAPVPDRVTGPSGVDQRIPTTQSADQSAAA